MKINVMGILKGVGTSLIKEVPGGEAALALVNSFLPDEKKLGGSATISDTKAAVDQLSPEGRAEVMMKDIDVELAEINTWATIQGHLASADASGNSTRPEIALMMAWAVCIIDVIGAASLAWAVFTESLDISDAWPMILALTAPPVTLLRLYFGKRTEEKKARYSAATGKDIIPSAMTSMVNTFLKRG